MTGSGPIFKLPSSWRKSKNVIPAETGVAKATRVYDSESQSAPVEASSESPLVEERVIAYHTRMARLELEEIKVKEELEKRKLNMNHDKLDNMNLEGVFNGETAYVPKRRDDK